MRRLSKAEAIELRKINNQINQVSENSRKRVNALRYREWQCLRHLLDFNKGLDQFVMRLVSPNDVENFLHSVIKNTPRIWRDVETNKAKQLILNVKFDQLPEITSEIYDFVSDKFNLREFRDFFLEQVNAKLSHKKHDKSAPESPKNDQGMISLN